MMETIASVVGPSNAFTNFFAKLFVAFQPDAPTLPLPSSRRTTSTLELHTSGMVASLTHACLLQVLRSKRSGPSTCGHLPRPTAGVLTIRRLTLVPRSQALEHVDHL